MDEPKPPAIDPCSQKFAIPAILDGSPTFLPDFFTRFQTGLHFFHDSAIPLSSIMLLGSAAYCLWEYNSRWLAVVFTLNDTLRVIDFSLNRTYFHSDIGVVQRIVHCHLEGTLLQCLAPYQATSEFEKYVLKLVSTSSPVLSEEWVSCLEPYKQLLSSAFEGICMSR